MKVLTGRRDDALGEIIDRVEVVDVDNGVVESYAGRTSDLDWRRSERGPDDIVWQARSPVRRLRMGRHEHPVRVPGGRKGESDG